jgi:hypothetical protein
MLGECGRKGNEVFTRGPLLWRKPHQKFHRNITLVTAFVIHLRRSDFGGKAGWFFVCA